MRITRHGKQRIVERDEGVKSIAEAKQVAKLAFRSGKTINDFQKCKNFSRYLRYKASQTCECSVKVYRGNIYIWKGRQKSLITAYPIPERFHEELEAMNK